MKQFPATSRTPCHRESIASTYNPGSEIVPELRGGFTSKFRIAPWVALFLGFLPAAGHAFTVQNANDSGTGSLREGIVAGGIINFAPSLSGQTILLTSELELNASATIDASQLPGSLTISGGGTNRLIRVNAGQTVTLRALTLINGNGTGAADIAYGGAIYNAGTTTLESCTFSGNSSALYGGAVSNSGILTVSKSTFNGNTAAFEGGGIYSDFSSRLTVENSTFTGNTATFYGGAIFNGSADLILNSVTLVGNNAVRIGGGIYNDFFGTPTENIPSVKNSIITANTAPEGENIFGPVLSVNNLTSGDPRLSPLGNFGGVTKTMPPLPDSPALDAGGATALTTDQRGQPRILNGGLDIGAFESPLSHYNPVGLTIYTRVIAPDPGQFEISTDPDFTPVVSTLAGTGVAGATDATRLLATLGYPSGVAQDSTGNIFFADTGNHRIRMFGSDGMVITIAGTGVYGMADGSGSSAQFAFPAALAVGPDDNLYVADTYNHRICKLTRPVIPGGTWTVTTLAGTGIAGFVEGAGSVARFKYPYGLALDASGNVYVADSLNHRIRRVTAAGLVSTYAGTGTAGALNATNALNAQFDTPQGVVVSGGSLYVADTFNDRIRKIIIASDQVVRTASTLAGSTAGFADGTGPAAKFLSPSGLAADGEGSLYVADEQNHSIRKIIISTGEVTTVAGTGITGLVNGKSDIAQFNSPTGVLVDLNKNLVVADAQNHQLRRIVIQPLKVPLTANTSFTDASGTQVKAVLDVAALGLDPSVTYYFRWKSSPSGITQLLGQSFFLYDFPSVETVAASSVTPNSAQLNANVDPKASRTVVALEYSTDPGLLKPYEVTPLAGSGVAGFVDSAGIAAQFSNPSGVAIKSNGDVFVADRLNHRVRKITAAGVVSTFVGSGVAGSANGTGTAAQFEKPTGLAIDGSGNLYVADESNHRIRKITPAGVVSTFAGTGVAGYAEGAAAAAKFLYPAGVAVDADGNVYVADSENHRIRMIAAADGMVTTLAGNGVSGFNDGVFSNAQFSSPQGISVSAAGSVLVADTGNHRIRVIDAGNVTTLAGDGSEGFLDGPGGNARFASPRGVALDGDGIAYISDSGNHRIRRIATDGQVSTLAGSGIPGQVTSPTSGLYPATACQFNTPVGITADAAGRLWVTQEGLLRKIARSATLPTVLVTPDATGTGERVVFAAVDQPLLYGSTYYFRARGTNYRDSVTGEILSFVTPQAKISMFAGADTSATAIYDQQSDVIGFGSTPTGQPVIRSLTIYNPGTWPLTVSTVGFPTGFQLTGGVGVIAPLTSLTFQLTLAATSAGTFSGNVVIHNNSPEQAVFTFPITGEVLDPPVLTTLAANPIGIGTATFNATVNPRDSSTTVWFEWSQDPEFDGVMVSTTTGLDLNQPSGIATDAGGNTYVADTLNHRIRKITPAGTTSTFAGTGTAGFADGAGSTAQFNQPVGLVISSTGVLFVTDSGNHRIRAIDSAGVVSTYSGLGTPGFTDGIATAARFLNPAGLAIDGTGILYLADSGNHRIRKVALDGSVSTLAGTGTAGSANGAASTFNAPLGIARDSAGFVYVTETSSHAIRKIAADGFTSVFAGSSTTADFVNASGAAARFSSPSGLAVGVSGLLYVTDKGNHRIRAISLGGVVTTFAGSGTSGTVDGFGEVAQFSSPFSLATTASGGVIVGEVGRSSLRKITSLQVLVQAAVGLTGTANIPVLLPITGLPETTSYYFRAIATNSGGTTFGNTLSKIVDPPTAFNTWQMTKFGTNAGNPLIASAAATPAGDGICNLLKYAFGLDPLVVVAGGMPVMGLSGGTLSLTYTKVLAATDLLYTVEWSADLANWSSAGVTQGVLSGNTVTQQILASVPSAPATAKFIRVRVTLQ